jgi:hypothetical protein
LIISTRPQSRQTAPMIGRGPGVYALVTADGSLSAISRNEGVLDTALPTSD